MIVAAETSRRQLAMYQTNCLATESLELDDRQSGNELEVTQVVGHYLVAER